jgi:hypothetical protein
MKNTYHFIIDTLPKVTEKINLLNSIENIHIASKIIKDQEDSDVNMID